MTGSEIQKHTKELEKPALIAIDKALGTIREYFKGIYDDCNLATWHRINSVELSSRDKS